MKCIKGSDAKGKSPEVTHTLSANPCKKVQDCLSPGSNQATSPMRNLSVTTEEELVEPRVVPVIFIWVTVHKG